MTVVRAGSMSHEGVSIENQTSAAEAHMAAAVDSVILHEMMLFFVHLALHAGRGWGLHAGEPTLPDEDSHLHQEAIGSLKDLLNWQPRLLSKLLSCEGVLKTRKQRGS
jgi:hypothetical protein